MTIVVISGLRVNMRWTSRVCRELTFVFVDCGQVCTDTAVEAGHETVKHALLQTPACHRDTDTGRVRDRET